MLHRYLQRITEVQDHARFENIIARSEKSIQNRMASYIDALRGGVSLFAASNSVERQEWKAYVDSLNIVERYPGINGMGVIRVVDQDNLPVFLEQLRADVGPDFNVRTVPNVSPPQASDSFIITYIEPVPSNKQAVGLDVGSEMNRRTAAERACDSGLPVMTNKIILVQDQKNRPGFLLYVPLYKNGAPTQTVQQRRQACVGWVYAPFITENFLKGVLGTEETRVHLAFYEGSQPDPQNLLYYTDAEPSVGFEWVTQGKLAGQDFSFGWTHGPGFVKSDSRSDKVVAVACILMSALISGLVWSLQTTRARADALTIERTQELLKTKESLEQSAHTLAKTQERLNLAVEGSNDGLWDWDIGSNQVWYSDRFKELLGYQSDEFPHTFESFESRLHPDDHDATLEAVRLHLEENTPFDVEYRLRTKTIEYRWFHARGAAVRDRAGKPMRMAGSIQDISSRKEAENNLLISEKGKSEILRNALDCVVMMDHQGKIIEFNPAAEQTFGYPREEVLGKNLADVIVPKELRESHKNGLASYLNTGVTSVIGNRIEVPALRRDGSIFPVELSIIVIKNDSLPPVFTGFIRDITERKQSIDKLTRHAAELEQLTEQLKSRNSELNEFTYVASHDLQEPLRKLVSFSSLLAEDAGPGLPPRAQTDLKYITEAAQRMRALVQDLLALSRASRADMVLKPVSLNTCVNEALKALEDRITGSSAQIIYDDLPAVMGDQTLLTQLYQNLIGNAVKYCKKQPIIHLTVEQTPQGVVFGVRDNGIGIAKEYQQQVFAPFKRLHGRSEYEGTGIGLAICRKAVERHGGKIWVESEPDQGSHFKFNLGSKEKAVA